MCMDPGTGIEETGLHDLGNGAVIAGADVEEEVAVFGSTSTRDYTMSSPVR